MHMPLPSFSWANGAEVWESMLEKDATYAKLKNEKILERHPSLVDSYRTILFDWLSEVSHECKFHRETYHLALDFIDRYLAATSNIGKYQLQLIGTTCLFLAAKYEEIRPPTVNEFAELTDGACRPEEIIDNEVVILSAINWNITPITPNSWLNIYMQILSNLDQVDETSSTTATSTNNDSFIFPSNNGFLRYNHKRIASVIDLALLHIESLRFSSSILAASAIYHFTTQQTIRQCSGYNYERLAECIHWLEPFVEAIREIQEPVFIASCKGIAHPTQMHSHIATAAMLDDVKVKIEVRRYQQLRTAALKRKAIELENDESSNEAQVTSASGGKALLENANGQVIVLGGNSEALARSPLKPSTTVLLTPPSSTCKARGRQQKRRRQQQQQHKKLCTS
jgi:cyclin E